VTRFLGGARSTMKAAISICWCNDGTTKDAALQIARIGPALPFNSRRGASARPNPEVRKGIERWANERLSRIKKRARNSRTER
jgi:hypothetical protein